MSHKIQTMRQTLFEAKHERIVLTAGTRLRVFRTETTELRIMTEQGPTRDGVVVVNGIRLVENGVRAMEK